MNSWNSIRAEFYSVWYNIGRINVSRKFAARRIKTMRCYRCETATRGVMGLDARNRKSFLKFFETVPGREGSGESRRSVRTHPARHRRLLQGFSVYRARFETLDYTRFLREYRSLCLCREQIRISVARLKDSSLSAETNVVMQNHPDRRFCRHNPRAIRGFRVFSRRWYRTLCFPEKEFSSIICIKFLYIRKFTKSRFRDSRWINDRA